MTEFTRVFFLLITFSIITACTSSPRVQSNYDNRLDFSNYKTYNFSNRTEIENPDQSGELELYFSAAVEREMLLRGLVRSDTPDILINVFVDTESVSSAPARRTVVCPRCEDYFSRRYDFSQKDASKRPMCIYKEGTVNVDMVNTELNQTIWEGVSYVRLDEKDTGDRLVRCAAFDVYTMFEDTPTHNSTVSPNPIHPYNPASAFRGFIPTEPRGMGETAD